MKKVLTLLTLVLMSIGSVWAGERELINYPTSKDGTSISGTTSEATVKINGITYEAYRLNNGYSTEGVINGNYILLQPLEGFKAGDVITINGAINNSDTSKRGTVVVFSANADNTPSVLHKFDDFINSKLEPNVDAIEQSYTLEADYDELYLGRDGNTGTNVTLIKVVRNDSKIPATVSFSYSVTTLNPGDAASFTAPTLTIVDPDNNDISDKYTATYVSDNTDFAEVDPITGEVTITEPGEDVTSATAKISVVLEANDEAYANAVASYTINFSRVLTVLKVSEPTSVILSRETIEEQAYLTVNPTDKWAEKKYGEGTYSLFNMSNGRVLTITVKGAKSFEVFVVHTNADEVRHYSVKAGNDDIVTVTHTGSGVETSGVIPCSDEEITITLQGLDGSVYPAEIRFNTAAEVSATITEAGYATFSSRNAVDFSAADVTVYTAKVSGNMVVLSEVTSKQVPADTGVILKGESTTVTGEIIESAEALSEDNELIAATTVVSTPNILIMVADGESVKFTPMTSGKLAAGKAYLPASVGARELIVVTESEATGISAAESFGNGENEKSVYDLQGRRVLSSPKKGVYVQDGRKMIVK